MIHHSLHLHTRVSSPAHPVEYQPLRRLRLTHPTREHHGQQLDQLCESIDQEGLHRPLLISTNGIVLGGERRLTALKLLGRVQVPVLTFSQAHAGDQLAQEADAHPLRVPYSPWQASQVRLRAWEMMMRDARTRQHAGTHLRHSTNRSHAALAQLHRCARETRTITARGTGYCARSLDKVDAIIAAAQGQHFRSAGRDWPVSAAARRVAQLHVRQLQHVGAAINPSYLLVREAITGSATPISRHMYAAQPPTAELIEQWKDRANHLGRSRSSAPTQIAAS